MVAEELQIFKGSRQGRIINEKQKDSVSNAWNYAVRRETLNNEDN